MKSLIVIALVLALASADYTPTWSSCSTQDDPWQPSTVTLDQKPVPNITDKIHACGNVQDDVTVGSFKLQVKLAGVIVFTQVVKLTQQEILPGSQYCFDYSAYIPPIAKGSFGITFNLQDDTESSIGCVALDLQIGN